MTTEDLMKLADAYAHHAWAQALEDQLTCGDSSDDCRLKARQALLDALEALGREVERLTNNFKVNLNALHKAADERDTLRAELAELKNDAFSYKVAWETVCDGAKDVVSDLEKARAELAAIRAQEPVATIEISVRGSTTTIDNHFSDVVRDWPEGKYQLYASPTAKDAGLVAALKDAATSLETISRLAGRTHYVGDDGERVETYMGRHDEVRGYATSRASKARAALSEIGGV